MARALVIAACIWPLLLGSAVWARARHGGSGPRWSELVYLAARPVCHQLPARSFFTAGVQWPVCGRCTGLYLSAPIGAWLAYRRRRTGRLGAVHARVLVATAALPSLLTIALEWPDLAPVTNLARALCALPLGAALAWVLVRLAAEPRKAIG